MTYEGKSSATVKRRKSGRAPGQKDTSMSGEDKMTAKLAVSVCVLIAASFLKLAIPTASESLCDKVLKTVSGSVDYEAAIATLGDAVSGEKNVLQALKEACAFAFSVSDKESGTMVGNIGDDFSDDELFNNVPTEDGIEGSNPSFFTETVNDTAETVTEEKHNEEAETAEAEATAAETQEKEDIAMSVFLESQAPYADLSLPTNVTYDMPVLNIDYATPLKGETTSQFGYREHPSDGQVRFHYGTDIGATRGTEVGAFADGTVSAVGDSSSYGLYVIVNHGENVTTLYAHLDSVSVSGGESISKGDTIGTVGDSGNATGYCLHFEIIDGGVYVNPEYYI